jgi:hypothetical protein
VTAYRDPKDDAKGAFEFDARPGWMRVLDAAAPAGEAEAEAEAEAGEGRRGGTRGDGAVEGGGAGDAGAAAGASPSPPGKLRDFSAMSGRAAVASYLEGRG